MNFSQFTGLPEKNTKQTLEETVDTNAFVEKLKYILNVENTNKNLEATIKEILGNIEKFEILCNRLGCSKREFMINLTYSKQLELDFLYTTKTINWIKRLHFSDE